MLDWAWQRFPRTHGPADEGGDWIHDLQVIVEEGAWHTDTLTVTGSQRSAEALLAVFDEPQTRSQGRGWR